MTDIVRWWRCLFGHHWSRWEMVEIKRKWVGDSGTEQSLIISGQTRTCQSCGIVGKREWH